MQYKRPQVTESGLIVIFAPLYLIYTSTATINFRCWFSGQIIERPRKRKINPDHIILYWSSIIFSIVIYMLSLENLCSSFYITNGVQNARTVTILQLPELHFIGSQMQISRKPIPTYLLVYRMKAASFFSQVLQRVGSSSLQTISPFGY